jgi:prepilin-type N-terminal cleavage/methylation domain-containing protein
MYKLNKKNNKKIEGRGFTLIELLVVIAIISLLSTIVIQQVNSARNKAKIVKFTSEIIQFQKAIQLYALDHGGNYPLSDSGDYFTNGGYDWAAESNVGLIGSLNTYLSTYIKLSDNMFDVSGVIQPESFSLSFSCLAPGCSFFSIPITIPAVTSIYYIVGENSEKILEWVGYTAESSTDGVYCGNIKINKYVIWIYTDRNGTEIDLGLSLPKIKVIHQGQVDEFLSYCIGE